MGMASQVSRAMLTGVMSMSSMLGVVDFVNEAIGTSVCLARSMATSHMRDDLGDDVDDASIVRSIIDWTGWTRDEALTLVKGSSLLMRTWDAVCPGGRMWPWGGLGIRIPVLFVFSIICYIHFRTKTSTARPKAYFVSAYMIVLSLITAALIAFAHIVGGEYLQERPAVMN